MEYVVQHLVAVGAVQQLDFLLVLVLLVARAAEQAV
jgi:hypothetical protein